MLLRLLLFVAAWSMFAVAASLGDDPAAVLHFYLPPTDENLAEYRELADKPQGKLRRDRAEDAFAKGKQAAEAGDCSTAARYAYETLYINPDHEAARKLLGYRKAGERWVTDFQKAKLDGGSVWHAHYGWVKADDVPRYENGERLVNGRWMSAADDAAFRRTIDRGWKIDTEHFRLTTNVGLEEGVRLAARLERLYHVWRQLAARYHTLPAEWKRLYAGGEPRKLPPKRYPVVYFRSKAEYVAALQKREPRIEMTSGIFMNDDDTAYFYDGEERKFLYHEVVHQLFMLTRPTVVKPATKGNFWIIEGIACYFESLELNGDTAELGDVTNARLHAARYRRLVDDFYVPLAELTTYSQQRLQADERIARLYSQASGLTWFLLHAEGGRFREATFDYLGDVYAGRDTPRSPAERFGRSFDELDAAYLTYLKSLPNAQPTP